MFTIRTASLDEIIQAHALIPEFLSGGEVDFAGRLDGKVALPLIALDGDTIAGYAVSYLKDDTTAYIWMVGTAPHYRRSGAYQQMYEQTLQWAKKQGMARLQLKTRNDKRSMLAWLVKSGFLFTEIETQEDIMDNRIMTEKPL